MHRRLQVGDTVWSMLPGARTLNPIMITSKHHVKRRGFVNVHTFQGMCCWTPGSMFCHVTAANLPHAERM